MGKLDHLNSSGRIRSVEREFVDYVCCEVGLSDDEITCQSHMTKASRRSGNRSKSIIEIQARVSNKGNRASSHVRFDAGTPGAKKIAMDQLADDVYRQLDEQEIDLRTVTA